MSSLRNRIYWRLPYFLKSVAVSWNSLRLDRQRYGPEYRRVLAEILERDSWSVEQMARYQQQKLVEVVHQAARYVPYYRRLAIDPEAIRGLEDLEQLPILEKQAARLHSADLVDERLNEGRLIRGFTSGTSGTPLTTYRDLSTEAAHFAYWDARARGMAGLARRLNRGVVVSGQLVTAPDRSKPPYWVHNWPWKQLYMSSYHLSPGNMGDYLEAIRRFEPEFIEGYPSSVAALARHLVQTGQPPIPLKGCFTTAETLEARQRDWIRRAFLCPVTDQYGCCEFTMFAAECDAGSLHLSPEVGVVEILDEADRPVPVGQVGQVVVTGLANRTQLFLRYRIGDRAALSEKRCCCGRSLPVLKSLEGRTDKVLVAADGRQLGRLCHVFDDAARIVEAQIIQRAAGVFTIRVVPASGFAQRDADHLLSRLRDRVGGDAEIDLVAVDEIPRGANGKFQAIIRDF